MKISLEESIGEKVLTIDVGTSYKRGGKLYFRAHQVESLLRESEIQRWKALAGIIN